MAQNRDARRVALKEFEGRGRHATDLPGPPAGSAAGAYQAAARQFGDLSSYLNAAADKAAVREGKDAGIAAALEQGDRLVLRRDGTLAGEAFDKAAADVYAAKLLNGVRSDLFEISRTHKGDPDAMRAAGDELKKKYIAGLVADPEIAADFEKRFEDMRFGHEKGAVIERDGRLRTEAVQEYDLAVETAEADVLRSARVASGDPAGDEVLAREVSRLTRMVRNAEAAGYRTPAAARARLGALSRSIEEEKAIGAFDKLQSAEEKARFVAGLKQDYEAGRALKGFDPASFDKLHGRLDRMLRQDVTRVAQGVREIQSEISSITGRVLGGYGTTDEEWSRLDRIAARTPGDEMAAAVRQGRQLAQRIDNWWQLSPPEIERMIAAERLALSRDTTGTAEEREARAGILKAMEKVQGAMQAQAADDPLALAERTGRITPTALSPLVLTNPQLMAENFPRRAAAAETAAASLGVPPKYFNAQERTEWAGILNAGGEPAAAAATAMVRHWGPERAAAALSEFKKVAPAMTTAAITAAGGGSPQFLADVAAGQKLRTTPGYKPLSVAPRRMAAVAEEGYGAALMLMPDAANMAQAAAANAWDVRVRTRGIAADIDVGRPGRAMLDEALQEALGARTVDGVRYGGVASYRAPGWWFGSRKVAVPAGVRADRFREVVGALRDDDLKALPAPPVRPDGSPLAAADLHRATPVAVAGGYRFAGGDPVSDDPKWVRGADGGFFTLPWAAVEPALRSRVPAAFIGGSR